MKCTWLTREFCIGDPTQPIFHLFTLRVGVGGDANFSVFRYQHVGIPNAKLWHWGSKPTRGPNANGFASQWNVGLTLHCVMSHLGLVSYLLSNTHEYFVFFGEVSTSPFYNVTMTFYGGVTMLPTRA